MAKSLPKALRSKASSDIASIARHLQSKGRFGDTVLAHINPREAQLLMEHGGAGTINPETGLPEFYDLEEVTVYATPDAGGYTPDASAYTYQDYGGGGGGGGGGYGGGYGGGGVPAVSRGVPALSRAARGGRRDTYLGQTGGTGTLPGSNVPTQPGAAKQPDEMTDQKTEGAAEKGTTTEKAADNRPWYQRAADKMDWGSIGRLGVAGLMAYQGRRAADKGAEQMRQGAEEQKKMAIPYQEMGRGMVGAATRGELTPQSQQAFEATRAQMAQEAESRGGVGAQQMAVQLEDFRQKLLQQQMSYGLQVANIGDNIAIGAIQTGMQADMYVNAATQDFYSSLGNFLFSSGGYTKNKTTAES